MAIKVIQSVEVVASGGTVTIDTTSVIPDIIVLWSATPSLVMNGNFELVWSATPPLGTQTQVIWNFQGIDYPYTYFFKIFGQFHVQFDDNSLNENGAGMTYTIDANGLETFTRTYPVSVKTINGKVLMDNSVLLDAVELIGSGNIIVGNSSNKATAVAMTGDVTISNEGVTAIGSGKVTNTMLAGSIARTKIVAGTANNVVINDGSGNLSSSATLSPTLGGTGQNNASATGFQKWSGGTSSVGTITDTLTTTVQWGTGHVGDFKVRMGFAGTVTGYYAFLAQDLGSTDGVITLKNNAGTTMTGGVVTFSASSTKGSTQTSTTSANNTFSAGDVLTFTTSGGGNSGIATISFDFTRNS